MTDEEKKLYKCLALSLVVSMAVSSAVYASPSKEGEGSEKAVLMSVSGKAAAVLADSAEGDGSEDPVPVGVWLTTADGKAWYFGGGLFYSLENGNESWFVGATAVQLEDGTWKIRGGKEYEYDEYKAAFGKEPPYPEGKGDVEDPDDLLQPRLRAAGAGPRIRMIRIQLQRLILMNPNQPPSLMHPTPHQNRPRSLPQSRTTLMARIKNLKTEIRRRSASGCPPVLQRYGFSAATLPMFFTMEI